MLIILLIHILLYLILLRSGAAARLQNAPLFLAAALLIPIFGPAGILLTAKSPVGQGGLSTEEAESASKPEDVYRSVKNGGRDDMNWILPIEEAMLVNEPRVRRRVMLDVLYAGTDGLVREIQLAGTNEDTEVVHYAVTALIELRKDFDGKIRYMDRHLEAEPENLHWIDEYILLDEKYLRSGLLDAKHRAQRLRHYRDLLDRRNALAGDSLSSWRKAVRAELELLELPAARKRIRQMLMKYPESELPYLSLLELAIAEKNPVHLAEALERIRKNHIHISPENRRFVDYWRREEQCGS